MIINRKYGRAEVFIATAWSIRDFGFIYEYKPPYAGYREIIHKFRIGLVFIRFYFTIFKPQK